MLDGSEPNAASLQALSVLADAELDAEGAISACAYWRSDAEARAAWYAYHLIGDVMRSDELASDAARDTAFACALRERLAAEPVVLAQPSVDTRAARAQAPSVRAGSRWSWMAPAAVAAGFMAVASVIMVTHGGAPSAAPGSSLAQSFAGKGGGLIEVPPQQVSPSSLAADASGEPLTLVADGKLVRDARLESYFAAHKQFGGSPALGVPSAFLRAATTQTPDR